METTEPMDTSGKCLGELNRLVEKITLQQTKHDKNVKCACTKCRVALSSVANLCKLYRICLLKERKERLKRP